MKMTKQQKARLDRLLPNGEPRWVRVYDNGGVEKGGSIDRYTVVFTGNYSGRKGCDYLAMNEAPFSPQGFCQHGWSQDAIDRPTYGHLGKKIGFSDLPRDCQVAALADYLCTWGLTKSEAPDHAMARKILGFKRNGVYLVKA